MAAYVFGKGALILERNPFAGKKILLSGSGQCNFSNNLPLPMFLQRCAPAERFLKPALYAFDNQLLFKLLEENACPIRIREDGKAFPLSLRSADIRDTFLQLALSAGAKISYNTLVKDISYADGVFSVFTDSAIYSAKKILLAGGGKSYPESGSDGTLYSVAKALGHSINSLRPALCGIEIHDFSHFSSCSGISIKTLSLMLGKRKIQTPGDILLTFKGLSGPGILDWVHLLKEGDIFTLQLCHNAEQSLLQLCDLSPSKELHNAMKNMQIADSLAIAILKSLEINPIQKLSELRKEDRKKLSKALEALPFRIKRIESWDKAMATAGGVMLSEVNAKSMESRLISSLYFAGEILDYSLPSGGFNIQIASSTGYLAGKSALKDLLDKKE